MKLTQEILEDLKDKGMVSDTDYEWNTKALKYDEIEYFVNDTITILPKWYSDKIKRRNGLEKETDI